MTDPQDAGTGPREYIHETTDGISRRDFLLVAGQTSAALVVGCLLDGRIAVVDAAGASPAEAQLNAWLRIAADDSVTIVVSQAEMGQGIMTTLPAVLAEELGADWDRVRLEMSPTAEAYRNPRLKWQFTGNSESTMSFFDLMRQVGASAREMLVATAAERWKVPSASCAVERGVVHHRQSSRRLTFGQLAEAASKKVPPLNPVLRPQSEWQLLGKSQAKVDIPSKVDGSALFGIDFELPDMVYAAVKNCPCFGGKLRSFDKSSIDGFPGVLDVVVVPGGVAVVATKYWQAKTALDALQVLWEDGPEADLNSTNISERYEQAMAGQDWVLVRELGDPDVIRHSYANVRLAGKAEPASTPPTHSDRLVRKLHSAEFASQFLAHAPMEPMNATARITEEGCEIWAPTQGQELAQLMVAQTLGIPKHKVRVNRTLLGGGFGRRLVADFALQVVAIAKVIGKPVKLIWSREEDMQHDLYRPGVRHRITVGLDADEKITAASHQLVSPSILHYVYPVAVEDDYDPSCLEGLHGTRYRIPNVRVDFHLLKIGVPASTSVLRTTGFGPNIFSTESFVDELAHLTRKDPYEFRRKLLEGDARALAVLDMAADKSGWKSLPERGISKGMAFTEAFNTLICQVVDLSVHGNSVRVHRVISVVDCGTVLNPNIAANNIEGGVAWGLSAAFKSEITFNRGRVVQSNWHDFQVLRLAEMPSVEVYFVDSGARPLGGTGEVGPVTVVPAVANALFQATGKRFRSVPLSRYGLELV
jgi:isoquinoline 1-oxidoreductase beta subunit